MKVKAACILLIFAVFFPLFAETSFEKPVRIGYFEEPGMMNGASPDAPKSGYGYDYIREVASAAGWKYEYVYGTFGELYQQLIAGQIDMLPYTTKNGERSKQVLFPDQAMGEEYLFIASMKKNRSGSDFSELQGARLGSIKGAFYNGPIMKMLADRGITCQFVEYATPEERWNALENGKVEYSIESSTVCQPIELHVAYELGDCYLYYLVISPHRADLLPKLNRAQKNVSNVNPGFLENLKLRYFRGIALLKELPEECQNWVDTHDSIRIGTYDNDEPYVIQNEDGSFCGILCDQVKLMLEALNITLPVEWKLYPGKEQALAALKAGELDCINPYYQSYAEAEADDVVISQPMYESNFSVLYNGIYTEDTLGVVATPATRLGASYVRDNYPNAQIVPCQNGYDCIEKLEEGEAHCVVMYTDALEQIAEKSTRSYSMKELAADCNVCFAALHDDAPLIGIFNKAIPFVTDVEKGAIQDRYSIEKNSSDLLQLYKTHPEYFYGVVLLVFIIIMILMFMQYRREISYDEKQKESEVYKSIIDRFSENYEAVFLGNLNDGSYKIVVSNKDTETLFTGKNNLTVSNDMFCESFVHPYDKERVGRTMIPFSEVRNRLPVGKSDVLEFRANIPNGYHWFRSTINRISEDELLIGFKDCDKEIQSRIVEDKLMSEYDAIYIADLKRGEIFPSRSSRVSTVGAIKGMTAYTPMVRSFAETVSPSYRQDWINFSDIDFMQKYLSKESHREYVYELPETTHSMRRFCADVVERIDGKAVIVLFSFMAIDDLRAQTIIMQRRMAEQKVLLDYFVDSYDTAFFVNLKEGTFDILHMKHEFSHLFGKYGNTRESMDAFIDEHIHPADKAMMMQCCNPDYVRNRLKEEDSFSFVVREEYGSVEKTMRGLVIRGADEDHVAVGFMDISEELKKEKAGQAKLEEALTMAQSANRAKTTFLNSMSHDIRTPMNAIIGYTELARKYAADTDKVQGYLDKIGQSGGHLLSLINDVLDMSRIESGVMRIEEKNENLRELINGLNTIVSEDMRIRNHHFEVNMEDIEDENIICDKLRLNQVLLNILSNSNKYTRENGSIQLTVRETGAEDGVASYEFCVSDNGIGMSPEFLKTMFDPFTRAESSTLSGIQGTGLGMSITKSIVDKMGGTIAVKSEEGKGTEVTVSFNFRLQDPVVSDVDDEVFRKTASGAELAGKKVLLVEDNLYNREIATEILEEYGISVDSAENGSLAVEKMKAAKTGDYDLILMDIQMPVMDGYEATRQIRALGTEIAQIPIIAMTANAFEEDRQLALESGMNEHIPKPIDFDRLEEYLERFI